MSFTTQDVARSAGLTERQLDAALRKGYIPHPDPNPGTGIPRTFTQNQRRIAAIYAELIRAGLTPRTAAYIANNGPEYEHGATQIRVDTDRIDNNLNDNREDRHAQAR